MIEEQHGYSNYWTLMKGLMEDCGHADNDGRESIAINEKRKNV